MFFAKIIQRSFYTVPTKYVRRKANPGIGIQTQVFRREGIFEQNENLNDVDDLESDFMKVNKTYNQYEREMQDQKEQMRLWVVKNKYFKQKQPNFLTYTEKEQIKLLHSRDPEEWNVDRLVESFPATPEIIQKIIRSKWVPRSAKRIKEHDNAVMKNWQCLNKGDFPQINRQLKEHLMKFSTRKKEDVENLETGWSPKTPLSKPKRTDFLSIITSCKGYGDKEPTQTMLTDSKAKILSKIPTADDEETYLSDKIKDKRTMRLQELKTLKLEEPMSPVPFNNPSGTGIVAKEKVFSLERYASDEIVVSREDIRKYEMNKVRDKIYIPRKLRQKGATYKVEDCYYDDDGELLYRVPGMTGKNV
ncbi:neugrin [Episyrphus balteatus]|uniref:neugrin n=1 Tax=Episyrphus balteatus TaxID=286459 RepID=UPI00248670D8|nr:neugrin [Episyrphus balteatus]